MAGVQGMAFTANELPSSANKERGGFCWQGTAAEAGSTDFFDQYVELGDSDAESATRGGGGGLGHFYGASDLADSPHMSFGQMFPPDTVKGGGAQGHLFSAVNNSAASSSRSRQHQVHPLHRATNMTALSNPEIGFDEPPYGRFGEAPGVGSISDSELLKLEGLTMRSPRIQIPQLSASEPASPPSKSTSPRKTGRLESFCTKIRNKAATLHGKAKQPEIKTEPHTSSVPIMSTAQMEPVRTSGRARPQNLHISKSQLPSPPLTSGMPNQRPATTSSSDASFVNGFLDDPFAADGLNGHFVPPLQLNGSTMPQTPLSTPLLDGWQLPISTTSNGKTLWTGPNPYFFGVNGEAGNTWWGPSADAMDTDTLPLSYHANANARNTALNLAIQLQHQQSFEYPAPPGTEDTAASFAPNGLLIHMPQPRGIPSAVLHSGETTTASHRAAQHHQRRPKPRAPSSGARHHQYGPGASPRKGRTVSGSGGTSANRISSVSPSPSKMIPTSAAASTSLVAPGVVGGVGGGGGGGRRLHRRSASMQTLHQPTSLTVADVGVGGPSAIRKRRSWTGRRTSSSSGSLHHQYHTLAAAAAAAGVIPSGSKTPPRSPSRRRRTASSSTSSRRPISSSSTSYTTIPPSHNHHHPHRHIHGGVVPANPEEDQDQEQQEETTDGFVNYTPQDHTLLMTGVAPSGSSKTKARREREAAERQREFRERLARMVEAAGGD
ncbi:regulatory protein weta, partial [Chaetomidium leptoderma]